MRILFPAAILAAALAFAAPLPAQSLPSLGLRAIAGVGNVSAVEEVKHQRKRVVKRGRRPYYVPYACSRPYKYYYWQFWPPVCYPL